MKALQDSSANAAMPSHDDGAAAQRAMTTTNLCDVDCEPDAAVDELLTNLIALC